MTCQVTAITVHGQQPAGPRSTIQTRTPLQSSVTVYRHPPRAAAAALVHRPYPMPTRHSVRHHHHDQPTQRRIRHTGSTTTTPGARSTNLNPWCGHRGPGSAVAGEGSCLPWVPPCAPQTIWPSLAPLDGAAIAPGHVCRRISSHTRSRA
ncbi:unnamed protein product [Pleuronectes platessa]|uniref:Uncharacterized protein n=1 Tax=Pleuronectes platessa TaxID=8262 RepID=A0A9N7YM47_PLEPL|nr:unnamed protein product [Pleuronectes platessa]